ncbi:hypothetical protein DY000_02040419 [Brassica cretica]|uniref:Uncharacterized protein n=1 Tax=Brassica cretica TaxID=69181 RepID=A0ABQ7BPB4_BRACR|nr:hypothetical protein DY000_02040419 [Brassica cretica]
MKEQWRNKEMNKDELCLSVLKCLKCECVAFIYKKCSVLWLHDTKTPPTNIVLWCWHEPELKTGRAIGARIKVESSYSFAGGSRELSRSLLLPPPFSTVALLVTALFLLPVQSISFLHYKKTHRIPTEVPTDTKVVGHL